MKQPFSAKDLLMNVCNKSLELANKAQYKYTHSITLKDYIEELVGTPQRNQLDDLVPNTVNKK